MKKIFLVVSLLVMMSINAMALDVVLCNFDDVQPTSAIDTIQGGQFTMVTNPQQDTNNPSATCGSFYNDQTNWQGRAIIPVNPFTIPASGVCFIAIKVKHDVMSDIAITIGNEAGGDGLAIRANPIYDATKLGEWQELIFDLGANRPAGTVVDTINFLGDMKWNSGGTYVTSSTNQLLFDEIRAYDVAIPENIDFDACDFESGQSITPAYGFTSEIVANPFQDSDNNTDNALKIGRINVDNFYALVDIVVDDFMVPQSGKCYVHVLVNSPKAIDFIYRTEKSGNVDYRALNPYTAEDINTWKDLVFDLGTAKSPGFSLNFLRFLTDNLKSLTPSTDFAYLDEIIVNEDPNSRTASTPIPSTLDTTISTFDDSGISNWVIKAGATIEKIQNPDMINGSLNVSDSCLNIGDEKTTTWAWIERETSFIVPTSACYLHVMVKTTVSPNLIFRTLPDNSTNIFPNDTIVPNDEWQDLVFDISANQSVGYSVEKLLFLVDINENNLNDTDKKMLWDEVIINADATPRTNTATALAREVESKISVYPNPAKNQLYITGDNVASISIYNAAGQMMMQTADVAGSISINSLKSGIFFINCKDENGITLTNKTFIKE